MARTENKSEVPSSQKIPILRLGQENQHGILIRQLHISQRRELDLRLLLLEQNLDRFREIVNEYWAEMFVNPDTIPISPSQAKIRAASNKLARDLDGLWTKIEQEGSSHGKNNNNSQHLLGALLAGFLEQCIEHGLTRQLTRLISEIDKHSCLQHDEEAVSNLLATQVLSFVKYGSEPLVGLDFFKSVTRPIKSTRLLPLFQQTIRKLELGYDVVLCLWLFHGCEERKTFRLRNHWSRMLREEYCQYMRVDLRDDPIVTALGFLTQYPHAAFFTSLQAALKLDKEARRGPPDVPWVPTMCDVICNKVKKEIELFENICEREEDKREREEDERKREEDERKREEDERKRKEDKRKRREALIPRWIPKLEGTFRTHRRRENRKVRDPRSSLLTSLSLSPSD